MNPPAVNTALADLTTLRVGGPIARLVRADSEGQLIAAVTAADDAGEPVLLLGGGSNLLPADEPFNGLVVQDARTHLDIGSVGACGGADVTATAGMRWDDLVVQAIAEGWSGVEALSGIPGTVGATPVQNVGAYGQEVGDVIASVRTWDREQRRIRTFARAELALGYRSSILKRSLRQPWHPSPRYLVLQVSFQLPLATLSSPIRYPELAGTLGVAVGTRADAGEVRAAVLALRGGKGMVLDGDDHDTWSAGSFFTNPILSADVPLPAGAPRFDTDGRVKTSAAWLIRAAGFEPGFALPDGNGSASLSTKHALAITNRGGARAADLVALARTVRDGVREAHGITLEPEPVLVGLRL
ncbi:MAG: UDP-N-acetylmuramate dehydrogenase [Beutenbergiaceae bacterium]